MSDDPTSPDAVARSMGLGATGLEAPQELAAWRRAPARPIVVAAALLFSGYVVSWGDVEKESRVVAALAGGAVLALCTLVLGTIWWAFRGVIGRPRPFGRAAFNYGLVGAIAAFGILGADEFAG